MNCPICGSLNVVLNKDHLKDGEIFVAKTMSRATVFYDEAHPHECLDCSQVFYLGFRVKDEIQVYLRDDDEDSGQ